MTEEEEQMAAMEAAALAEEDDEGSLGHELSQEEIDSLLGISSSEEGMATGLQALVSSSNVTYERLPILEVIFDRLVRSLSTALRNFTGEIVDVSLEKIDSTRFGEYIDSLPLPILIGIFEAVEWENSALITVDSPLVYSIVDLLMGGKRGPGITKIEGRPYTSIERTMVERLLKITLGEFTSSFAGFEPVKFSLKSMETNPRFATIVRPVNACIRARLKIEMDGRGGVLEFLIPYSTLEPVRSKLMQMIMGEKMGNDNIWERHFEDQMWGIQVNMEAVLKTVQLDLSSVLAWKPGDRIIFKEKPSTPIEIKCGGYTLFEGKLGRKEKHVSLKIDKVHSLTEEDQA